MTCETLALYLREECDRMKAGIGMEIETAIREECITPNTFIDLTRDDLKEVFSDYISYDKIPFGVLKFLEKTQTQIQRDSSTNCEENVMLREFDTPSDSLEYKKGHVSPPDGNLLIPAHEFRTLPNDGEYAQPFIMRESIRFIAACLNTRKNGTIHFGIQGVGNGCGYIVGINNASQSVKTSLNIDLNHTIDGCFEETVAPYIKRCVRPFQVIPVEDGSAILEMDVVPYSDYTKTEFFYANSPPKGKQDKVLIVYNSKYPWDIVEVSHKREEKTKRLFSSNIHKRKFQENNNLKFKETTGNLANKLVSVLTAGSDYVTDQFTPLICCGQISGCKNESEIRQQFDVPEAFLSSTAIFDFDSSVDLRNRVEKEDMAFDVLTADDTKPEGSIEKGSDRIWMYCNGNAEVKQKQMNIQDWYRHRFNSVRQTISACTERTPRQRSVIIFLAFCKQSSKDALLELAEDCIKSKFRDQCVIIAETEEVVTGLKDKLKGIMSHDEMAKCFHTGMAWKEIADILKTVFRETTYQDYKLPCSNGHFAIMTAEEKRKLNFTDIEILGGEECKRTEMTEDDKTRRNRKKTEQEKFYKGNDVTWWNFYYGDQVGKRDLHTKFLHSAKDILQFNADHLIEVLRIRHQPGAGGSTAGKFLLWQLSQFENQLVREAFRCCVIKQITEDTANQIYKFLSFKDKTPKPVVFLTDNENEEHLRNLLTRLNPLSYKHANPGRLFALHIAVNRVSVSYAKGKDVVLKHLLSRPEQTWFDEKSDELKLSDTDVKSLISFNVMKESFDKMYIKRLACNILKGIKDTELDVLKCLSLINTFDRDNMIPVSTFDCLVAHDKGMYGEYTINALQGIGPIGLTVPKRRERQEENIRRLWNVDVTEELALLLKRRYDDGNRSGVMIISQALAEAVLEYILTKYDLSLHEIVEFVLDIVKEHAQESNQHSKQFVKVVNSLFKTRSILAVKGNRRTMFSDMILALQQTDSNKCLADANMKVVELMERAFTITSDALVGQQLARFLMSINDFEKAEKTIEASLTLKPNSSYILSTYGQVFRCKMETMIQQKFHPISDNDAVQIIESAFKAMEKCKLGQRYAKSAREMEDIDRGCFFWEVKTLIFLLEKGFPKFACYIGKKQFLTFLNNPQFDIKGSSFSDLSDACSVDKLQKGSDAQIHAEESLRRLEEGEYQIKRNIYKTDKSIGEKQISTLRISFEDFYGTTQISHKGNTCYLKGLKSLMKAKADNNTYLCERVTEAEKRLQCLEESNVSYQEMVEIDDLLILLGFELIQMSGSEQRLIPMDIDRYKRLLWYSEILLDHQCSSSRAYLEAFLYFAILHWPSETRLQKVDSICKPQKYIQVLKDWKRHFDDNFDYKNRAKNYFVLGKGDIGCDIVDLDDCIRIKWIEKKGQEENRKIGPVFNDDFWKEPFVVKRLERLHGKSDSTGNSIEYQIKYQYWEYNVSIRTYYPCPELKNRRVTFILGFTWGGLAAFDVEEIDKSSSSTSRQVSVVDDHTLGDGSSQVVYTKTDIKIEEDNRHESIDTDISAEEENKTNESRGRSNAQAKQGTEGNDVLTLSEMPLKQEERPDSKSLEIEASVPVLGDEGGESSMIEERPDSESLEIEASVPVVGAGGGESSMIVSEKTPDSESMEIEVSVPVVGAEGGESSMKEETPDSESLQIEASVPVVGAKDGKSSMLECLSESDTKKDSKIQKNAVVLLNDRIKNLKYEEEKLQGNDGFLVWTTVEGTIYEGRGNSKKQAKLEAARNALSGLESASPGEHAKQTGNKKSKKKKR